MKVQKLINLIIIRVKLYLTFFLKYFFNNNIVLIFLKDNYWNHVVLGLTQVNISWLTQPAIKTLDRVKSQESTQVL